MPSCFLFDSHCVWLGILINQKDITINIVNTGVSDKARLKEEDLNKIKEIEIDNYTVKNVYQTDSNYIHQIDGTCVMASMIY